MFGLEYHPDKLKLYQNKVDLFVSINVILPQQTTWSVNDIEATSMRFWLLDFFQAFCYLSMKLILRNTWNCL